jgi:uncharacterized phage protein gp47/JayE
MTDLADLIETTTQDEELTDLLAAAATAGFPTTSWQSGSVPRTLLEIDAQLNSGVRSNVADIAKGGFLDLSTAGWLTLLAKSVFDEDRVAAVITQGGATLTCASNAGPYTIGLRSLWVSTAGGKRFTNITAGTLSTGGTLALSWEAEQAGSSYNVAANTITVMTTPLAGVTVNNPSSSWITQTGADEESDEDLVARCREKWAILGTGSTEAAYSYWAKQSDAEIRRVVVRPHDNEGVTADGHVTVVLAGESGTVSSGARDNAEDYIEARREICAQVHVVAASVNTQTVTATLTVRAANRAQAEIDVSANLVALAAEIEIGGTIYRSALIEALMEPTGMVNASMSAPAADVTMSWDEIAAFTEDLTWVEV